MRKVSFFRAFVLNVCILGNLLSVAQTPTLIGSATYSAFGAGVSGIPAINYDIPAGSNRMMIISCWSERVHSPVNSNWITGPADNDLSRPTLEVEVNQFLTTGVESRSTASRLNSQVIFSTAYYVKTFSESQGLPTGPVTITFPNINVPTNAGDEIVVSISVFEHVNGTLVELNSSRLFNFDSSSLSVSNSGLSVPVGRSLSEAQYLANGMLTQQGPSLTFPSVWTAITNLSVNNSNGTSISLLNENDGIRYLSMHRNGIVDNNFSVSFTRSGTTTIHRAALHTYALLPLAKPQVSGTVYVDNNGLSDGVNGGGLGGGTWNTANTLWVNAIKNGEVIATAPVNTSGVFTFPAGSALTQGDEIIFQLSVNQGTVGQAPPPKELPNNWVTVGESTTSGPDDGSPDGEFILTIGTASSTNNTTNRFGVTLTYEVSGKVFDDINYGGGAGRSYSDANSSAVASGFANNHIAVPNARVELYNSAGTFVSFTTTAADGSYSFSGLASGSYTVRVVNSTVQSRRAGAIASLRSVQTYRNDASTGVAVSDPNRVGGENPVLLDAGNGSTTLAALSTTTTTAQSIAPVTLSSDVDNLDFGFNFNTIVNTNNTGQGSLRQFILNANALSTANLDIQGQPAGRDVSIFMISDGNAVPGLRAGLPNQLTSGVASITLSSALTTISGANITIDGTTQTTNVGNTNTGSDGYSGTVGVGTGASTMNQVDRPEVEINRNGPGSGTSWVLRVSGTDNIIRGVAIRRNGGIPVVGVYYDATATNMLLENNFIGTAADSFSDLGAADRLRESVWMSGNNQGTLRNNLIGYGGSFGILLNGSTNILVEHNSFASSGSNSPASNPQEQIRVSGVGPVIVRHNYIGETIWGNIDLTGAENLTLHGNTIENGMQQAIGAEVPAQNAAVIVMQANDITISNNIIRNTASDGHGILVNSRAGLNSESVRITQNSIYNNALLGININISDASIDNTDNNVTPNDGIKDANTANHGMDYPVATSVYLDTATDELIISGYVGNSASGNPVFGNSIVEVFLAESNGNEFGEIVLGDGLSEPHGQGRTYLGTFTTDANGLFTATLSVSGVAVGDFITMTATDTDNNTSEFSNNTQIVDIIALPIELLYIKAYGVDDKFITVEWATATELNNQGFEIERSENGFDFRNIGWQEGAGTSTSVNRYAFDDHKVVKNKVYYYRVKQIDFDGTITYTNIVSAMIDGENENSLTVYPNPNVKNNTFSVDLMSSEETTAQLFVYDLHGKVFYTQPLNLKIGNNVYHVPSNNLESGQYMIVIRAAHVVLTEKVVVID